MLARGGNGGVVVRSGLAEVFLGLEDGAVVLVEGLLELLVGVDEGLHRVVVRCGVLAGHVPLDGLAGAGAALGELLDEVVGEDFLGGRRGDELFEELG